MAQFCEITGIGPKSGNLRSHANNKNRTRWIPNLKYKRYVIEETGQSLTLRVSAAGIKTIQKQGGLTNAIFKAKEENLSERLVKIKSSLEKRKQKSK
jgi:large subunit ribosomal protein L28